MNAAFPSSRLRRLRQSAWSRDLVRESHITCKDLIYPLFITEGAQVREPIDGLPGQYRLSVDQAAAAARSAASLGIALICLFPNTPSHLRDEDGSEALNPDNLVVRAIKAVKEAVPEIGVMVDIALDPYTSHGHDGLLIGGKIVNDATNEVLVKQALMLARAGADVLSPSDMMDGRIGAIRDALESAGEHDRLIFSYAAKYASSFYGPFREAVGASHTLGGDKKTYQMDPANGREAIRECQMDADEGADALIVKPGTPYLDVLWRVSEACALPSIAYQVSGEYAMIKAAAERGWIDEDKAVMETMQGFKRAGASAVITYFAPQIARLLAEA